jgi:amidase
VIILGKTNTPEFGLLPVTEPELFGPTNNPWDLGSTAGGSSGGSAAAVAAGLVPLAHGGDGGGSIRIPASCCGLFGLKPSRGRNPSSLDFSIWQGSVCEHVITRSVRDSAAMLDATSGPGPGARFRTPLPARPFLEEVEADPGRLRVAFSAVPLLGRTVHDDCIAGLEATVKLCKELGHEMVEATPQIHGPALATAFLTMLCAEVRADIDEAEGLIGRRAKPSDLETETWALAQLGGCLSGATIIKAVRRLQRASRQLHQFFEDFDALLTPTLARPPVVTGTLLPQGIEALGLRLMGRLRAGRLLDFVAVVERSAERVYEYVPYTVPFNVSGQPAMSVPLHWSDEGLPIGMHFVGRCGDEATLFRLAGQLERARPWFDRRPPICCTGPPPLPKLPPRPD